MAQKKSTAAKTAAKRQTRSKTTRAKAKAKQPQDRTSARYIMVLVFLLMTVVTGFACFSSEGLFLVGTKAFLSGLVGRVGLYLMPFLFLGLSIILAFLWKKHLVRRCLCAVLTLIHIAAIVHLLTRNLVLPGGAAMVGALYTSGASGVGGGVLGGLLAALFNVAFGRVLSVILLFLLGLLCALCVVDITVLALVRAFRDRPRPEYDDEEDEEEPAAKVVNHFATRHVERVERKRRAFDYDIPVDDVSPAAAGKKTGEKKTRMRSPDQVVEEELREARAQKKRQETAERFDEDPITGDTVIGAEQSASKTPETQTDKAGSGGKRKKTAAQTEEESPLPDVFEVTSAATKSAPAEEDATDGTDTARNYTAPQPGTEKVTAEGARASAAEVAQEVAAQSMAEKPEYIFPPLTLLRASSASGVDSTTELRENSRRLNEALQSFKIEAKICNVTRGPSITRYEVELAQGVRLAKITTLQNDLALALGAASVRISAIPEKIAMVGIEVPNKQVTMVSLREVIGSSNFICAASRSTFAVGKDIGGECIVGDIAGLPHMLIAGTTGSGKSVCMNSLIVSLLYKASPEDVKLIMVDPKMVELGIYNGIPHLLIPVVTDPKKAAGSLQWAVSEMMRRYKLMHDVNVRTLDALNGIVESTGEGEKLPQIVVIIDELADLMMVAAKEVEDSIVRIAQMGRASGIHLIIATQRPSADVITGIMKANIPSRIAFAVASAMESRIILDTPGAEKLVGRGDMLYAPLGKGKPHRVQGCFVSDAEVEAVAEFVKERSSTDYSQDVLEEIEKKAEHSGKNGRAPEPEPDFDEDSAGGDEMLPAAVEVFLETGQASVSMLQRRLKLGYARAARIVDEMEEKGIVGPFVGSKPRAILVTKEQWYAMQNGQAAPEGEAFTDEQFPVGDDPVPDLID